jgi:hypothetical protein
LGERRRISLEDKRSGVLSDVPVCHWQSSQRYQA